MSTEVEAVKTDDVLNTTGNAGENEKKTEVEQSNDENNNTDQDKNDDKPKFEKTPKKTPKKNSSKKKKDANDSNGNNNNNENNSQNNNNEKRQKQRGDKRKSKRQDSKSNNSKRKRPETGNDSNESSGNCSLYIANIDFHVTWKDIKALFNEKVGNNSVEYVTLFKEVNGEPRGCGLIKFKDHDSALKGRDTLDKFEFQGRKLVVKFDVCRERDCTGRLLQFNSQDNCNFRGSMGGDYSGPPPLFMSHPADDLFGFDPEYLASLEIMPPLTNRVFIANIRFEINEGKLRGLFKDAGRILKLTLTRDREGKSRGYGIVEYASPVEAVKAVAMFNQRMFHDRPLAVRLDRSNDAMDLSRGPGPAQNYGYMSQGPPPPMSPYMSQGPPPQYGPTRRPSIPIDEPYVPMPYLTPYGNHHPVEPPLPIPQLQSPAPAPQLYSSYSSYNNARPSLGAGSSPVLQTPSSYLQQAAPSTPTGYGGRSSQYGQAPAPVAASHPSPQPSYLLPQNYSSYSGYGPTSSISTPPQGAVAQQAPSSLVAGDTIWIRNLPSSISWQQLVDRFSSVGKINYADIKPNGNAYIQYSHAHSAQRACAELNNIYLDNRAVEVNMYY